MWGADQCVGEGPLRAGGQGGRTGRAGGRIAGAAVIHASRLGARDSPRRPSLRPRTKPPVLCLPHSPRFGRLWLGLRELENEKTGRCRGLRAGGPQAQAMFAGLQMGSGGDGEEGSSSFGFLNKPAAQAELAAPDDGEGGFEGFGAPAEGGSSSFAFLNAPEAPAPAPPPDPFASCGLGAISAASAMPSAPSLPAAAAPVPAALRCCGIPPGTAAAVPSGPAAAVRAKKKTAKARRPGWASKEGEDPTAAPVASGAYAGGCTVGSLADASCGGGGGGGAEGAALAHVSPSTHASSLGGLGARGAGPGAAGAGGRYGPPTPATTPPDGAAGEGFGGFGSPSPPPPERPPPGPLRFDWGGDRGGDRSGDRPELRHSAASSLGSGSTDSACLPYGGLSAAGGGGGSNGGAGGGGGGVLGGLVIRCQPAGGTPVPGSGRASPHSASSGAPS